MQPAPPCGRAPRKSLVRTLKAAGEIAEALHDLQGAGVVVLEIGRGDDGDGQDFGIADPSQDVVAVTGVAQQLIEHDEGGYNHIVVHGASGRARRRQAPPVFRTDPMNAN